MQLLFEKCLKIILNRSHGTGKSTGLRYAEMRDQRKIQNPHGVAHFSTSIYIATAASLFILHQAI